MSDTWTRPFHWGVIMVTDEGEEEVPEDIGTATVAVSESALSIRVRHAQDIEIPDDLDGDDLAPVAEVVVTVRIGSVAATATRFDHTIATPSRRVSVGDADDERVFTLDGDRTRVQIDLDPLEHAERVTIWLAEAL